MPRDKKNGETKEKQLTSLSKFHKIELDRVMNAYKKMQNQSTFSAKHNDNEKQFFSKNNVQ